MVGASLGLSYSEGGAAEMAGAGPGMFQNVYMQPWAYRRFLETGEFAEETMFVLAFYEASREADPALRGLYEGEVVPSIEVHLKQRDLHESGWGYYAFGSETESAEIIPGTAACYACHREKTALDNVFVQFYPPLRPMLRKAGGD